MKDLSDMVNDSEDYYQEPAITIFISVTELLSLQHERMAVWDLVNIHREH